MLRTALPGKPRAIDLFCGAGGMSIGLEDAGYAVVLGIDVDEEALNTHRSLCPGLSVDWDLADPAVVEQVGRLVDELDIELVAGGPPCQPFSKAGRSMLRHLVSEGRRDAEDLRAQLWRSFMRVIEIGRPPAVMMENVPDMALDRDMLVVRTMTEELEQLGYSVHWRLVDTFLYGVPQFRQRLILIALADGIRYDWPDPVDEPVSLRDAISDLPPVEGGWRPEGAEGGWTSYAPENELSAFAQEMRAGLQGNERSRVRDHITRPVREDDRQAFALMDPSMRYSELPDELKRYRDDIFDDKYKRLAWDDYCRTITAHIAKDGYWYIHPEQERTLTVREAARVQTFPDHVRFAGPPTAAFRQIGNAVPPRAARQIAKSVRTSLHAGRQGDRPTGAVSSDLADWLLDQMDKDATIDPRVGAVAQELSAGRHPEDELRWPTLITQLVGGRLGGSRLEAVWSFVRSGLADPGTTISNRSAATGFIRMQGRAVDPKSINALAEAVLAGEGSLGSPEEMEKLPGISRALSRLVCRLVPGPDSDPVIVTSGLLRVAARYLDIDVDNQNSMSDGRLAIARLIGTDDEETRDPRTRFRAALASLALLELADRHCWPTKPQCGGCPLADDCRFAIRAGTQLNLSLDVDGRATI
ncbi:DNA (cytosine-5-)-methyltransferase [Euzebya tangerina]|uniref:DNA (cytosine-5-)-methyltransferase n=1 Tax=Euzebya tangerina TaxID=591198 RepID=UPI00196B3D64|nr:DNA (cytosine-5-)-methyltransferase [Euzebya tangerina]